MVALPPLLDGGHPDIISTLSSALIARVQAAPLSVQQFLYGPLGPLLGPQPVAMTVEPVDFSVVLDDPMPVAVDETPVEDEAVVVATNDAVVEPTFTPLVAAAPRTLSFATVAIAPTDDEPEQVQSTTETPPPPPPPAPAPVANIVAQAKPPTVAHAAAPPAVAQPQVSQPVREKPVQEVKHPTPAPVAEKEKKNGTEQQRQRRQGRQRRLVKAGRLSS